MKRNYWKLWLLAGLCLAIASLLVGCQSEVRGDWTDVNEPEVTSEAHHLTIEEAQEIAINFWNKNSDLRASKSDVALAFAEPTEERGLRAAGDNADAQSSLPAYYVFNVGEGFVIVSAWDVTFPILGFSTEGNFFGADIANAAIEERPAEASNVLSFLSAYATCIDSIRQVTPVTETLRSSYRKALDGTVVDQTLRADWNSIAPLLGDIKWNQSPYYNEYIPYGHPVGCVATATTQIMRYWKYPPRGTGSHTSTYDGKYANFDKEYKWDEMPAARLRQRNHQIAQLSYDVAVGLNMMFSANGSGTWQYYVPGLLRDHFYYKNTIRHIYRSNYTTQQWEWMVYSELAEDRPVQYAGSGRGGGHSFVCDGYHSRGYFHINWGWGGMSDGYFLLHALDPNSLGTGGGSGGFNYGQDIVIGIEPNEQPNPNPDPRPVPGNGEMTPINLTQFTQMLTFRSGNRVDVGGGYQAPMVVYIKATDCSYCEHTEPSIELLAKEYRGKVPFYSFDLNPNGDWEHWEYISKLLNIETVPRVLFVSKDGTYVLRDGVLTTSTVEDGAKVFRPYVEALLGGGDEPTPSGDYCDSKGRYARSTYIAQVKLSNVNNYTRSNEGGYNYFDRLRVELTAGNTYNITLTPGSLYGSYAEYFRVWIDLNGDKQFSRSELVADFVTNQANLPVTKSFTLPSDAKAGTTRMRVSMKWGSAPEACETFEHGEVEDYPVVIKNGYNPEPDPEPTPDPDPEPEPTPDPTPEPGVDPYPQSYGKDSRYGYISHVSIGDMSNSTKGNNYASYIDTHHITSSQGRAISFNLTPGFGTRQAYWCYWRIWIDYNKDGKFASNEMVVSRYGYQAVSGWFTLPYRMDKGLYRVRVSMKMNEGYPAPDEVFNYGEVEDYRLRIN